MPVALVISDLEVVFVFPIVVENFANDVIVIVVPLCADMLVVFEPV